MTQLVLRMLFPVFRKSLILTLIFLLFGQDPNADATLILGYQLDKEDFNPIQFIDPNFEWSRLIVDANEWPASTFNSHNSDSRDEDQTDYEEQFKNHPGAEEAYVNKRLKEKAASFKVPNFPEGPTPKVLWVPTTLWDLFVIRNYALSESFWRKNAPIRTTFYFSLLGNNKNAIKAEIFSNFIDYIRNLNKSKLSVLMQDPKSISQLVLSILNDIEKADPQNGLGNEIEAQVEIFKAIFRQEALAIQRGKPSFLTSSIKIEIEAYQSNSALLWRSTNGLVYCLDPEEAAPESFFNIQLLKRFLFQTFSSSSGRIKTETSLVKKEILDFPTWSNGPTKDVALLKDTHLTHLGFSFSFSPLAGFLLDGIFSKSSACSFVYSVRDKYKYTYFLMLDKKWLNTEGRNLFVIPNISSTEVIFSRGEYFHPRTYDLAREYFERDFSISMSAVSPQPIVADNKIIEELKTIFANRFPDRTSKQLEQLANFLIAGINFDTQISSVIAREARIFRIGNRIVEDSRSDHECQSLIEFQEQAAHLLERKLKWLFIHQQLKNKICIEPQ